MKLFKKWPRKERMINLPAPNIFDPEPSPASDAEIDAMIRTLEGLGMCPEGVRVIEAMRLFVRSIERFLHQPESDMAHDMVMVALNALGRSVSHWHRTATGNQLARELTQKVQ